MSNLVLFKMWEPERQSIIKRHNFYIEEAKKRLLSQFQSIESEADQAANKWFEEKCAELNPEYHDPGDLYEAANDYLIDFYELLSDMHEITRLSIVSGVFYEWEKQLRSWLEREIRHWHRGENLESKLWSAEFSNLIELLESFGWKIRESIYFRNLDACRLVVNVYKHGSGKSFSELKNKFPEYIKDPFAESNSSEDKSHLDYNNLRVSDEQLREFSDAILAFWRDVPSQIFCPDNGEIEAPAWFENAIKKDRELAAREKI